MISYKNFQIPFLYHFCNLEVELVDNSTVLNFYPFQRRSSVSQDPSSKKPNLILPPTRIYRRVSDDVRGSNEYKTKRLRNNDAVRRSRENSKMKREEERQKFDELLQRYNILLDHVKKCKCIQLPDFLTPEESK